MLNKAFGADVTVEPNPATKWAAFDYTLPGAGSKALIKITDATGRTIKTVEVTGTQGQYIWDFVNDILAVEDGYFIIGRSGSSDGDISFNHGAGDGWLVKTNKSGDLLWEKTYGGSEGDSFYRIFPDGKGKFYIIGISDSSDGDISNDPYPDSMDLWLLKIDADGNIIWEEIYGGTGWEMDPTGISTSDGGLVALVLSSSGDGDISNHFGLWDAWMIKVNSDGEKQWDFTLGSPGQEFGRAIIQTSDGNLLWQQCFGGILNEEVHFGFHYISENNFIVAGQTNYGPSFDVGCTPTAATARIKISGYLKSTTPRSACRSNQHKHLHLQLIPTLVTL